MTDSTVVEECHPTIFHVESQAPVLVSQQTLPQSLVTTVYPIYYKCPAIAAT